MTTPHGALPLSPEDGHTFTNILANPSEDSWERLIDFIIARPQVQDELVAHALDHLRFWGDDVRTYSAWRRTQKVLSWDDLWPEQALVDIEGAAPALWPLASHLSLSTEIPIGLEGLALSVQPFLQEDGDIWSALVHHPTLPHLKSVELSHQDLGDGQYRALAKCGVFERVQELSIDEPWAQQRIRRRVDRGIATLAVALPELHTLTLSNMNLHDDSVAEICREPKFRRLGLRYTGANGDMICDAVASSEMPRLQALELTGTHVGAAGARRLAEASLPALRTLMLTRCPIGAGGLASILSAPWAPRVQHLDLGHMVYDPACFYEYSDIDVGTGIGLDGVSLLSECTRLDELQSLSIAGNNIDLRGIERLVQAPFFSRLTHLDLSGNDLSDDGARVLIEGLSDSRLRELQMIYARTNSSEPGVGRAFARALSQSPHCENLETLSLVFSDFDAKCLRLLGRSPYLKSLKKLYLTRCDIDDEAMFHLTHSDNFKNLEQLHLKGNTMLDDHAVSILAAFSSSLPSLRVLDLSCCSISPKGVDGFSRATGFHTLAHLNIADNHDLPRDYDAAGRLLSTSHFPALQTILVSNHPEE